MTTVKNKIMQGMETGGTRMDWMCDQRGPH